MHVAPANKQDAKTTKKTEVIASVFLFAPNGNVFALQIARLSTL